MVHIILTNFSEELVLKLYLWHYLSVTFSGHSISVTVATFIISSVGLRVLTPHGILNLLKNSVSDPIS